MELPQTAQMSFTVWLVQQAVIHSHCEHYSTIKMNEWLIYTTWKASLKNEKRPVSKGCMLYSSTDVTFLRWQRMRGQGRKWLSKGGMRKSLCTLIVVVVTCEKLHRTTYVCVCACACTWVHKKRKKNSENRRWSVDCSSVRAMALISSCIRCYHEERGVKGTQDLSALFATTCQSIIISK